MKKSTTLSESDLAKIIKNAVEKKLSETNILKEQPMDNEDEELDDPNTVTTFPLDDPYFELSDSDMTDIDSHNGPKRKFRGSIYIDYMIPETDDKEYDRKLAKEVLEYLRKKLEIESYVGGVGFRTSDRLNPFDMDF
jgi:hypothetical protein